MTVEVFDEIEPVVARRGRELSLERPSISLAMADSAAAGAGAAGSDATDVARLRAELEAARAEAVGPRRPRGSEASAAALRHELHALRDDASRTATPLLDEGGARRVSPQCKVCGARVVTSWLDTWSTSSHAHAGGHLFAGGSSAEM